MKLNHFSGLYGENISVQSTDFFQAESLELRSKIFNWEIEEHFHSDLFQIFLIKSGSGELIAGKNTIQLKCPTVLLIPANTLHGFRFSEPVEGEVLTFSQRFLENTFKQKTDLLSACLNRTQISFERNGEEFEKVNEIYTQIQTEIRENRPEKTLALRAWIELMFLHFYRNNLEKSDRELLLNNRTLAYYQQFLLLIKSNINQEKKISQYAKEMEMTVVHLNRICRQISDKSALQIVHEIIIQEAKNYLLNTGYSVSEIAYFLNFNDPAYFNRLFKKVTGVAPGEFRKG